MVVVVVVVEVTLVMMTHVPSIAKRARPHPPPTCTASLCSASPHPLGILLSRAVPAHSGVAPGTGDAAAPCACHGVCAGGRRGAGEAHKDEALAWLLSGEGPPQPAAWQFRAPTVSALADPAAAVARRG